MKGRSVRYTLSEDKLIAQRVRQNPMNLQMAFEDVAKEIGRTTSSVQGRYYNRVRFMFKMFYIETVQEYNGSPYIICEGDIVYNIKNLVRR